MLTTTPASSGVTRSVSLVILMCASIIVVLAASRAVPAALSTGTLSSSDAPITLFHIPEDVEAAVDCLKHDALSSLFCLEEAKSGRHMKRALEHLGACDWETVQKTTEVQGSYHQWFRSKDPEPSAFLLHWWRSGSLGYENTDNSFFIPESALEYRASIVERCEVSAPDGTWTFDRMPHMKGQGGFDWHTFTWSDAGGFAAKLDEGDVWVTAYAFMPMDDSLNVPLGYPPIHIHHEHVTSGQAPGGRTQYVPGMGFINEWGTTAVEFDVHGDRQCFKGNGGVECLLMATPPGYGMRMRKPMLSLGDLNDVRPANSPEMEFSAVHAWRWTHWRQRQVARLVTGTTPAGKFDENAMLFDPNVPNRLQYLTWSEINFAPYNLTIFRNFWHTHHPFTADEWLIKGSAEDAGLDFIKLYATGMRTAAGDKIYGHLANLTENGLTIEDTMAHVTGSLQSKQAACMSTGRCAPPRLLCTMSQSRWEHGDDGDIWERKVMADCDAFQLEASETVTLIGFHRSLAEMPRSMWVNMHTAWYASYVAMREDEFVPHMLYASTFPHAARTLK